MMNEKEFMIYAYHPPMKGVYEHDHVLPARYFKHKDYYDSKYLVKYNEGRRCYTLYDVVYEEDGKTIKDFRTPEHFKEQLDCGINVLFLQRNAVEYNGEPFERSELKTIMDRALAGGVKKIILFDARLHSLSASRTPLIGENELFKDMDELVAYCKACVSAYKEHPAFYGVYLLDEPTWQTLPQVCLMYRALKAVDENIFVQANLLPLAGDAAAVTGQGQTSASLFVNVDLPENQGITVVEAYRKYLETYVELSGSDSVTMDSYPIREKGPFEDRGLYIHADKYLNGEIERTEREYYILPLHFPTLQILSETCKKYGCKVGGVSNSCAMIKMRDEKDNILLCCHKAPDEQDMRYQVNAYMAFGAKIYSYYIYWARRDNEPGCYHLENTTVMSQTGEKLPLYFALQKIHGEMQTLAKTLWDFEYQNSTCLGSPSYLKHFKRNEIEGVNATLLSGEAAIITELVSKEGKKIYGVVNPVAPDIKGEDVSVRVRLEFSGAQSLKELSLREGTLTPLTGDTVEVTLSYGETRLILAE